MSRLVEAASLQPRFYNSLALWSGAHRKRFKCTSEGPLESR